MIETILRITFSLLIVLGLMWGMARLVRRPLASRGGGTLSVLARQQLSRGSSVAVVRVADRALILGVTDTQVTMLGETDLDEVERHQPKPAHRRHRGSGDTDLVADSLAEREAHLSGPDTAGGGTDAGAGDPSDPARRAMGGEPRHPTPLDGSILSPRTWRRTVDFLRERTTRR